MRTTGRCSRAAFHCCSWRRSRMLCAPRSWRAGTPGSASSVPATTGPIRTATACSSGVSRQRSSTLSRWRQGAAAPPVSESGRIGPGGGFTGTLVAMQPPPASDATIVAAIAAGDPGGLDAAYRRYADRLYGYARSIVGEPDAAADVVQETFLLASQRVRQLRDAEK